MFDSQPGFGFFVRAEGSGGWSCFHVFFSHAFTFHHFCKSQAFVKKQVSTTFPFNGFSRTTSPARAAYRPSRNSSSSDAMPEDVGNKAQKLGDLNKHKINDTRGSEITLNSFLNLTFFCQNCFFPYCSS